jgi:hypothetical protein
MDNDESFEEEFDEYYEENNQSDTDINDNLSIEVENENYKDKDESTKEYAMNDIKSNQIINKDDNEGKTEFISDKKLLNKNEQSLEEEH